MSGYLHRLAASTIRQQPRVHPFTESIYLGARSQEAPGFVFHAEETSADAPIAGAFLPVMPSSHPSAQFPASEPSGPGNSPAARPSPHPSQIQATHSPQNPAMEEELRLAASSTAGQTFQPLLPPLGMRQPEAEAPNPAYGPEAAPARASKTPAAASPSPSAALHQDASSSRAWTFEPIVAEAVGAAPAGPESVRPSDATRQNLPAVPARAASRPGLALNVPVRRAAPPQTEEIQIHIGRIEVIAVPPPAPRAVPAPARKGLTLDEYLSRSGGRAG